jgi:putative phosphoribosyl transferase
MLLAILIIQSESVTYRHFLKGMRRISVMQHPFRDRTEAGHQLAALLTHYRQQPDVLVLGLPRGGVPVAAPVAYELVVPLDVFVVRKLGVPGHEELAMGALATGNTRFVNEDVLNMLPMGQRVLDTVTAEEQQVLSAQEHHYRGTRPAPTIEHKTIILIDDGLATGATMRAAVASVRQQQPARLVIAVPVAPPTVCQTLEREADEVVCLLTPGNMGGVSAWYQDFAQVSDEHVRMLLLEATERQRAVHANRVDDELADTFPASDPPSWMPGK